MPPQTFFLVSLPTSISQSGNTDEALTALRSAVQTDNGTTFPFAIPNFKVGTLDALVQQADDLTKLEGGCKGVVDKVQDSLRGLLEGDEQKLQEQKVVNDRPVENYLQSFSWNKVKYRADKPIAELVDMLQKEASAVDNDVRAKFNQYNQVKTSLAQLQRSTTGNLSQKSLTAIVNPDNILKPEDSEYLQQHLVAVPNTIVKDFLKSYESISPMVVPRSAQLLAKDDEFQLWAVTVFKKHSGEFVHKCREHRWTPRDLKFNEGGREGEEAELRRLEKQERKVWGEALRLGRTGYSDAVMAWIHVLTLRVFVETVLRYGLPLDYVSGLIKTDPKRSKKAKAGLDARFSELGGNAMSRDKKGRAKQDDSSMQQEMAGFGGGEGYEAYVFYQFEII
ncbi:Vacuolar ATP synthase subunit C [Recurvomyces mirabilis]|uniref:V-type proton ATPase subunit C n=1 Tax=Recurvomyces mirabilis TaxID=574656 RepID=A0AAE0TSN0_9PEZI|nr:Vacuolar ATP synthase subunit C [Recurvomyces mirabilis]KAK5160032.1 Vacuolar ATP synthase subunit C [Recurvomyces mirabilis]